MVISCVEPEVIDVRRLTHARCVPRRNLIQIAVLVFRSLHN